MKAILALLLLVGVAACDDGTGNTTFDARPRPDADHNPDIDAEPSPIDAAPPDADCVTNPTTPEQILNACTTAQRVAKDPAVGCWYDDGGLPPPP